MASFAVSVGDGAVLYQQDGTGKLVPVGANNPLYISGGGSTGPKVTSVNTRSGDVTLTKSDVGLSHVDDTSDAGKPVSTAQQSALDLKAPYASPAFTGTPTAPTPTAGNNSTQVSNTAFVKSAIATAFSPAAAATAFTPPVGWYAQPSILSAGTGALVNQRLQFTPLVVGGSGWTADAFRTNVTTASAGGAGVTLDLALYADNGTGFPDTTNKLTQVQQTDFTTGAKTLTFSSALALPFGLYWVASLYQYSTAPTTAPILGTLGNTTWPTLAIPSSLGLGTIPRAYILSAQTAMLTTALVLTGGSNITGDSSVPLVALRRSA